MNEANPAVFLSYASQDAEAVAKICDALRAGFAKFAVLCGHHKASGQALNIPLPRGRQGFIKVVNIKNKFAFGRSIGAKIE